MVAVLLSFALYFLKVVSTVSLALGLVFLLSGIWTVLSGFMIAGPRDRTYYGSWGVFLACISLFAVVQLTYAVGITLLAMVGIIVVVLFRGKSQTVAATSSPLPPSEGKPAASAK